MIHVNVSARSCAAALPDGGAPWCWHVLWPCLRAHCRHLYRSRRVSDDHTLPISLGPPLDGTQSVAERPAAVFRDFPALAHS